MAGHWREHDLGKRKCMEEEECPKIQVKHHRIRRHCGTGAIHEENHREHRHMTYDFALGSMSRAGGGGRGTSSRGTGWGMTGPSNIHGSQKAD